MIRNSLVLIIFLFSTSTLFGQGRFSGDLMLNNNFYVRDSSINAANTPHYDNILSGADGWLSLNYGIHGFEAGIRFDLFNNSNLHNPTRAYSDQGIGAWYIRKKVNKLTLTGGYFYEQFGSGITFRAYEDRGLGIDNAIFGINLRYDLNENIMIKGFTGRQKNLFDVYSPVIKGINVEGLINISDSAEMSIVPGASIVNRTIDQQSMDPIVSQINGYPLKFRFSPSYNVYTYSIYNTLNVKNICLYVEYGGKTEDVYYNFKDTLSNDPGSVFFTSATYSKKGFGITLQYKRTENFSFRTSPNEILLHGVVDFLPPMARQNTYRLAAYRAPATQAIGEQGFQMDITYSPKRWMTFTLNYSEITQLEDQEIPSITPDFDPEWVPDGYIFGIEPWYREIYLDGEIRKSKKWKSLIGFQYMNYNEDFYQNKPGKDVIEAFTPLTEITFKFDRRRSLRMEAQYQFSKQGSSLWHEWVFGLLEFNIAPKYSFGISDMYNNEQTGTADVHYYSAYASYTNRSTKYMLSYIKQVEGVVCTGGVCRYEPAFSGVKFSLTTSF